ncbi:MAG: hypothetical protein QGM50_04680 [Anaerolineae bacterium]|nr:hypothetical protein [Anaerolineae bacterium]MDK1118070.1 hypothetical protein [Anaerolineae bacterium]
MAHPDGDSHCSGRTESDAIADPGIAIFGRNKLVISTRRHLQLSLFGMVLITASIGCNFASNLYIGPESDEELQGAAPANTAPAELYEPGEVVEEEPVATEVSIESEPILEETAVSTEQFKSIMPLSVPTIGLTQISDSSSNSDTDSSSDSDSESQSSSSGAGVLGAIHESRRLTLEFPPVMRTGDANRIRLQLEVDDQGNIVPTAFVEGNVITGEVIEIPNLYETHNVIAEARLDMAGMEVQPGGTISEPLLPGSSVTYYWSVRPEKSGTYQGTAWLHLRFLPKDGGEESRTPISVQFLEIEVKSFLGVFSGSASRGIGALGSVLGAVLGFPFIDDFIKWLWGRLLGK